MVLTQGKTLGPSMVLAPSNANSFAAMAPSQSLLIGGQVSTTVSILMHSGYSNITSLVHAMTATVMSLRKYQL